MFFMRSKFIIHFISRPNLSLQDHRRHLVEALQAIENIYFRIRTRAVNLSPEYQLAEVLAYVGRRMKLFQEMIEHYAELLPELEAARASQSAGLPNKGLSRSMRKVAMSLEPDVLR